MSTRGDMLRLARQRLGLTQKEAASLLNIVQPVLSRIENGAAEADDALLFKASLVYQVPRSFFDIRDPVFGPPVSVHAMMRSKSDVTGRDVDMITAELNIRIMNLRKFFEGVDISPSATLPPLDIESYGSAEKIADLLRLHWHVPEGPIKNLCFLLERAGVVIGWSSFGGASVGGVTFRVPGIAPMVLLNEAHPSDRLRFTLAHELGHLVMHRFPTPTMEDEANQFAAAFLMPAREVSASFQARRITLERLAALKPEWKVAMQALLMRASSLGFISTNQSRYLWQQISARGWRLREPPDLDFEFESPTMLPAIIEYHLKDLRYSLEELAALSHLFEDDFKKLYPQRTKTTPQKPRLRLIE